MKTKYIEGCTDGNIRKFRIVATNDTPQKAFDLNDTLFSDSPFISEKTAPQIVAKAG